MFELSESKNQMIIGRNKYFLLIGILGIIMAIAGVRFAYDFLLPLKENFAFSDVFRLIPILLCIAAVFGLGVYAFVTYSKRITIDREGILCESMFGKQFIRWDDIQDWGLSYCGTAKPSGNAYFLYFSDHECYIKNRFRKKLRGKMIKTMIVGKDYHNALCEMIPFCKDQTDVTPFVPPDKFHFFYR